MSNSVSALDLSALEAVLEFHTEGDRVESRILDVGWTQRLDERVRCWIQLGPGETFRTQRETLYELGTAALNSFLQSSVTGPPLAWDSADRLFPRGIAADAAKLNGVRRRLIQDICIDGENVYHLVLNVELFSLAKYLLNFPPLFTSETPLHLRWARVTVNFWHQRLLSENVSSLQESIYQDLEELEERLAHDDPWTRACRLVQRATIHTQHGFDQKARDDLRRATLETGFEFQLTGRLGKRTKFQEKDLSQLVVLAKSADGTNGQKSTSATEETFASVANSASGTDETSKPEALDLNDDTLLETIAFSTSNQDAASLGEDGVPASLTALDPSDQPTLQAIDAIILLAYASSITNTSPADGLTREETLPYATRVLQGSSNNWQVYTQALLLRSRIEGYKSRTVERGLLQLQALVDQVIVETTPKTSNNPSIEVTNNSGTSSFLPRPKPSESAPASERLQYIHQLASPTRWELEAELASRWISLGGIRTALEIYERLQMWAEVALCWAANDREDKAKSIVRWRLYRAATVDETQPEDKPIIGNEETSMESLTVERDTLPTDAPRLFCILGDLEGNPSMYDRAWEISNRRYARAQRSLGKYYFNHGEIRRSEEAYALSLKVNALNHNTWFSLGCIRLQLEDWPGAVDAFSRAIQIEDTDAETWSNLAAALLQLPSNPTVHGANEDQPVPLSFDDEEISSAEEGSQKHIRSAFTSLKRAAALKRDSYRIWSNLLNVAVKLSPPPYTDMIIAQSRLIDLLAKSKGEQSIDTEVLDGLVTHFIAITPGSGGTVSEGEDIGPKRGFESMLVELVEQRVVPLITSSRRLYLLMAKYYLHLKQPYASLQAYEKAWRVALNRLDTASEATEEQWNEAVDATVELVDAYESLGQRRREGSAEGELVMRDWKFKSRSAIRGILGRGREMWEESDGWQTLKDKLEDLKA
ncbi:MAG: hypothetical protein LQ350_005258 [Teloschistes chrysophthalmus]|nr:MAG: hypothetical protein LQ350_005258 [Niorma chrysophthalma]